MHHRQRPSEEAAGDPFRALSAQRTPGLAAPRRVAFKKERLPLRLVDAGGSRWMPVDAGGCRWMPVDAVVVVVVVVVVVAAASVVVN